MKKKWVVAVSGGPDSMYLLQYLKDLGYNLIVAHVNYKMREESDDEALMVEHYANKLGIPFRSVNFHKNFKGNFQKAARDFRYAYFKKLVLEYNACGVAIGHHQDDDLETFMMQKKTKRNTDWPGLKEKVILNGILVWRPLLKITKDNIIKQCEIRSIPYAIDKTNLEPNYTRNRFRMILEKMSLSEKDILLSEMYSKKKVQAKINSLIDKSKIEVNPFSREDFLKIDDKIRHQILRRWLEKFGIEPHEYSFDYIQHLIDLIIKGKGVEQMGQFEFSVSYGEVCVQKDVSYEYIIKELTYHKTDHYEFTNRGDKIEGLTLSREDFPIKVRTPKPGDKIEMLYGTKKINRFFIDRKIPHHRRKEWLVIENCVKDIVFVAELGCDVHHYSNNPNVFVIKL